MIEYASFSEIGNKQANEDAVKVARNQFLSTYGFVLADGLGGYGNGDVASNFVSDCVCAAIEGTADCSGRFIDNCFQTAQDMLMDEKQASGLMSIKTTLVTLIITGDIARWGHIGDSRLYVFRGGKVLKQTLDHSVPQLLALNGKIKEKDIRRHPERNMLLRAMGDEWNQPDYEIDEREFKVKVGDFFLLCSDGFWDWIDEKTMLKVLKAGGSVFDMLDRMRLIVEQNGCGSEMDNYSAILVSVS